MSTSTLRAPLDPPRSGSERRLRRSALWQLLVPVVVLGVNVPVRIADDDRTTFDVLLIGLMLVVAALSIGQLAQIRAFGSWRSLAVEPGETLLWGTVAALILPTGGAGYGGRFVLSSRRLRYLPDLTSRLRGGQPAEWPVASIVGVEVSPVDHRRRLRGGAWVVLEIADADPVTILTPEPHAVAAEFHEHLASTRPR
ncbi:hypothetical protein [Frigoribacterium sp. Leaf172]|uniref:hypothetical protein n=1 Tax=Frigoribacterium sp. Leaf172 TaxID=1736285 RepID=UPI0012E7ED76|nr:hypothetical protein [Frigoribacterium sp. Leaf172]